jgi:hypothetical protein
MGRVVGDLGITLRPVGRVVRGRQNIRGRVRYGGRIPEQVILEGWHKAGFGGFRLPPYIWRVLGHVPGLRRGMTLEQVKITLDRKRQEGGEIAKLLPRAQLIWDLMLAITPRRLAALVARHSGSDVDQSRPGVPDLFLFKRRSTGVPYGVRFVEVKRPGEAVAPGQIAEIRFLRELGFKAGVVRLIEREVASGVRTASAAGARAERQKP